MNVEIQRRGLRRDLGLDSIIGSATYLIRGTNSISKSIKAKIRTRVFNKPFRRSPLRTTALTTTIIKILRPL